MCFKIHLTSTCGRPTWQLACEEARASLVSFSCAVITQAMTNNLTGDTQRLFELVWIKSASAEMTGVLDR